MAVSEVGLKNTGNTCYVNAVLQSLAHVPSVIAFFGGTNHRIHALFCDEQDAGSCVPCALRECFGKMGNSETAFAPLMILKMMSKIFRGFVPGRQEDAHEFLSFLIRKVRLSASPVSLSSRSDSSGNELSFSRLFRTPILSEVTCLQCSIVGYSHERGLTIGLNLEVTASVEESLARHFAKETEPGRLCGSCLAPDGASTKQARLHCAPAVLILRLARETPGAKTKPVSVPDDLCIGGDFLDVGGGSSVSYTFAAMIQHHGYSIQEGHYTATTRTRSGTYRHFDDATVRTTTLEAGARSAYILFYERADVLRRSHRDVDVDTRLSEEGSVIMSVAESTVQKPGIGLESPAMSLPLVHSPRREELPSPTVLSDAVPDTRWVAVRAKRAVPGRSFSGSITPPSLAISPPPATGESPKATSPKEAKDAKKGQERLLPRVASEPVQSMHSTPCKTFPPPATGESPNATSPKKAKGAKKGQKRPLPQTADLTALQKRQRESEDEHRKKFKEMSKSLQRPYKYHVPIAKGRPAQTAELRSLQQGQRAAEDERLKEAVALVSEFEDNVPFVEGDCRACVHYLLKVFKDDPHLRASAEAARRKTDGRYALYLAAKHLKLRKQDDADISSSI